MDKKVEGKEGSGDFSKEKPSLRRGVVFITPNNGYYRNKNLGFGWAITHESETELTWGEDVKEKSKERLDSVITSLLNRLSLRQCEEILECDIDEAEVDDMWVRDEVATTKNILYRIITMRVEEAIE